MQASHIWENGSAENYDLVVDFMISEKKSFEDLEKLNYNQIEFLLREVEII